MKKLLVSIKGQEVGDPPIPIWMVTVRDEEGEWPKTFGSRVELEAFLTGLEIRGDFCTCCQLEIPSVPELTPSIPPHLPTEVRSMVVAIDHEDRIKDPKELKEYVDETVNVVYEERGERRGKEGILQKADGNSLLVGSTSLPFDGQGIRIISVGTESGKIWQRPQG